MKVSNTAERLRAYMKMFNMKQVDILNNAKPICQEYNVKLNKSDLSQYVSGKVEPNQDKLAILGMTLNVNETWLMGFDVPMERMTQINRILTYHNKLTNLADKKKEQILIDYFYELNDIGKNKLLDTAKDLIQINAYQAKTELLNAAHERTDLTEDITEQMRSEDDKFFDDFN